MDLTRFLELLKLKPETLLGILIGTGTLVFMPDGVINKLGLLAFVSTFRGWLGGAFVLSLSLLLGNALSVALREVVKYITEIKDSRKRRESFQHLSPPEKALLAKYYIDKTPTQYFRSLTASQNDWKPRGLSSGYQTLQPTTCPLHLTSNLGRGRACKTTSAL